MSWTSVTKGNAHGGSGTTVQVALTGVASGDVVIAGVYTSDTTATISVTNGGDTFTSRASVSQGNGLQKSAVLDCLSATVTGSVTYTVTTSPDSFRKLVVWVFRPSATATFDVAATGTDNTANHASGNVTTTGTDELSFAFGADDSTGATSNLQINGVAATASDIDAGVNWPAWYVTENATYTGAATWTESGGWGTTIVSTYKISGGGGGATPKRLLTLGVG